MSPALPRSNSIPLWNWSILQQGVMELLWRSGMVWKHFLKVADPFHWMENPDAEETKAFIDAQNAISRPFLDSCRSRQNLHSRLTKLWDFPNYSCPHKMGSRYHLKMNTGLQNQRFGWALLWLSNPLWKVNRFNCVNTYFSVLYIQDTLDSELQVFLDPNLLSVDGTVALSSFKFTEDGEKFAYGLSHSGSDWNIIHFKNVDTGQLV